jgi:hypothetical protein
MTNLTPYHICIIISFNLRGIKTHHEKMYPPTRSNLRPNLRDLYHRVLIGQEDTIQKCRIFAKDMRVRHNADFKDPSFQNKAYARTRRFHSDLGLDRAEYGDWQGVLILEDSLQGFKRGLDDDGLGGPARAGAEEVCDLEDDMPD